MDSHQVYLFTICRSKISGTDIINNDDRNGYYDFFLYDLTSNREFQLTNDSHDHIVTEIKGNTAVFEDGRNGSMDVWKVE